ncbi:MAG: glycosyltransferase family 1 protein [Acidobacteria bacterium]|nr:glycosyltransferase family 1 protein [Acidobacteriota bacterium]
MTTSFRPAAAAAAADLLCFSHLRWTYVFQRPQHLMVRFSRTRRVFFVEEPLFDAERAHVTVSTSNGVHVVVPHLPQGLDAGGAIAAQRRLLDCVLAGYEIERPIVWLYTPMALPIFEGLEVSGIVYDCMDELAGFAGAPQGLREREQALLRRADVVFTGGVSLYEAKKRLHRNIHPMPSSVDVAHFRRARGRCQPPLDQRRIARPRLGFCGVIDERMNIELVQAVAERNPAWQFVMLGPVCKIDPESLPRRENVHYLGMKAYDDLPAYMAGWDVALMPFAHNDATRYISPTKTPEYLAAGCPVVSTSIRDVVRPYGELGLVEIADSVEEFEAAVRRSLTPAGRDAVKRAEAFLSRLSWDQTFASMHRLIEEAVGQQAQTRIEEERPARPVSFVPAFAPQSTM